MPLLGNNSCTFSFWCMVIGLLFTIIIEFHGVKKKKEKKRWISVPEHDSVEQEGVHLALNNTYHIRSPRLRSTIHDLARVCKT